MASEKFEPSEIDSRLGIASHKKIQAPQPTPEGTVPDVRGLDAPTAVKLLEQRGIDVALHGSGRVVAQSLPHGTRITPGTSITLRLKI